MNLRSLVPANSWPHAGRWLNAILGAAAIVAGLVVLVALRLEWINILPSDSAVEEAAPASADAAAAPMRVQLPPQKLAAANLHIATAEVRSIQSMRTVPGTIAYDAARRLPVNSPVAGVVLQALALPGQLVSANQPLAVLSSPEVGLARDAVLRREDDLALARKQQAFSDEVATSVERLLSSLQQKPKLEEVEKTLEGKLLGEYREKVVSSYSKLVLAERLSGATSDLKDAGALSRRTIDERKSNREVAAAQFAATCETARFSSSQERDEARAAAEQAERLLAVAQQSLANLLGPLADRNAVNDRERLSEFVLQSPIAGRIEERQAVEAARVVAGGPLFTVADTSTMWVSAEIHERDWPALEVAQKDEIRVRMPALGDGELTAKVLFVAAQVSAKTRAVPLIAEISNAGGHLKPGMFVWALVPLAQSRQSLVVPPGAIMRHENQAFVFVPAGQGEFRRVDVQTGLETSSGIEILAGIRPGEQVVDHGAFHLKSELLLEREE